MTTHDPILLELSNNPSSEAIFATMSMQLKSEGGFDRVLALLNELVEDGRKQLHDSKKIWEATSARCDVSTMKFNERQDFYENRLKSTTVGAEEAGVEAGNCSDLISSLGAAGAWFQGFLQSEVERHGAEATQYQNLINAAAQSVIDVDAAIQAVQSWTAQSQAFLQTSLNKITGAYLQLHKYNIVIPQSFVQMAASDEAVRQRLLEWLTALRVTFLEVQSRAQDTFSAKQALWKSIETQASELISQYEKDVKDFTEKHTLFAEQQQTLSQAVTLFQKLVNDNGALITSNQSYCDVEKSNFEKAKQVLEAQLKLFRDIRAYFKNNYAKINEFVKDRYNH